MVEYIEREAVRLAYINSARDDKHWTEEASAVHWQEHRHIIHVLDKIPAADVVEVVRCKDCFYNANGSCTKSEEYDDTRYRPDYFCADGERRKSDV